MRKSDFLFLRQIFFHNSNDNKVRESKIRNNEKRKNLWRKTKKQSVNLDCQRRSSYISTYTSFVLHLSWNVTFLCYFIIEFHLILMTFRYLNIDSLISRVLHFLREMSPFFYSNEELCFSFYIFRQIIYKLACILVFKGFIVSNLMAK